MTTDHVLWVWLCTRCGNAGGHGIQLDVIRAVNSHLCQDHAASGTSARVIVGPVTQTADITQPQPVWSMLSRAVTSLHGKGGEDDGRTEASQVPEAAEAAPEGL